MTQLQNLNDNANAWSALVKAIPFTSYNKDFSNAIENTLSVYIVSFIVAATDGEKIKYYIGQGKAKDRANAHKSEYLNCKTTTRVGKSKLYTNEFLGNAISQRMEFIVYSSGHNAAEAKIYERELASKLTRLFGDDVITQPTTKLFVK
jgi:hypothetical protein